MNKKILTAIDANINRALEGLRVCEDYLRFSGAAGDYAKNIKFLRHRIRQEAAVFPKHDLLNSRDVASDTTKFVDAKSEKKRESGLELFFANLHRATEAARSIEEFSKLLNVFPDSNPFQEIRFSLYDLEQKIFAVLSKHAVFEKFRLGLYALLDSTYITDDDYCGIAEKMIAGGAGILQLRMKGDDKRNVLSVAKELSALCREKRVVFIVNDHVDVACLSDAHGVHLGQDDIPVTEARKLLPVNAIIGISTHSVAEYNKALETQPDYIALGPVYDTKTKNDNLLKGIGFEDSNKIEKHENIPLVAIGGITAGNVQDIISHGYDTVAVISALYKNGKYEDNCRQFVKELKAVSFYREEHEDREGRV